MLTVLLAASSSVAAAGYVDTTPPPALLVIQSGQRGARAERFVGELALVLDDFALIAVEPSEPRFATLPLAGQLEVVRPEVQRYRAVAAVWLADLGGGQLMVHVAAERTGRIMVRTVGTEGGARSEARLALAVRALLGMAYLFEPEAAATPALAEVVEELRQEVAVPAVAEAPVSLWRLQASAIGGGAVTRHRGAAATLGMELGIELPIVADLSLGVAVEVARGPTEALPEVRYRTLSAAASLVAGYGWSYGGLRLSALAGLAGAYREATFDYEVGQRYVFASLRPAALLGARAGLRVTDKLSLTCTGKLARSFERDFYMRESTGRAVLSTPSLSWAAGVGVETSL